MAKSEFIKHIEHCEDVVSLWPEWKKESGTPKTSIRAIIKAIHQNWQENELLLKLADAHGIHDIADRVGGGWMSIDEALKRIGEDDGI